jgi:two-component system sensor kinase FixL
MLGSKSNMTIPLLANGEVFGALSFSTLRHERNWAADDVAELKLVAQIIGNVVGRRRAEDKVDQLRRELAHTMRVASLGGLAEGLAHELNKPLAAILSNAQAARRFIAGGGIEPDELRNILDDIVRADKRAGNVIHNLRAMVSKRPADREPCCLNEIVAEVQALLHAELLSEHIEVRSTLTLGLPLVHAARVELQQVLVNLLVNAMHAMRDTPPAKRVIQVETRGEADSVLVSVRDHGHGIAPERVASVFEPFFSTKADGLGMGLSICRTIIETLQGCIKARNRAGGGAEFWITIPAMTAPEDFMISSLPPREMHDMITEVV